MNIAQLEDRLLALPELIGAAEQNFNDAKDAHAHALYDLGMETAIVANAVQVDGNNADTRETQRKAGIANNQNVKDKHSKSHVCAMTVSFTGAKLHALTAEYDAILTVLKRHTLA